jgi:hypothetical protein
VSVVSAVWEDDDLIAALQEALRARQTVPDEFVEAGKSAFAWRNIDAELARLTYDSVRDLELAASVRAEEATIRALTFTSARLTIELEVTSDAVVGQIVPAQPATLIVQPGAAGTQTEVRADEIGCFTIQPIPAGAFRLQCRTDAGVEVMTGLFTI